MNQDPLLLEQLHQQRLGEDYIKAVNGEGDKERLVLIGLKKVRVNIFKNFGKKTGPRAVFGYTRLGLADDDSLDVVQKRFDYCTEQKDKLSKIAEVEVGNDRFDGVPLRLCRMVHTGEMIVSSEINLGDDSQKTKKQIALLQQINEIIISKRLLDDMEFIGFTTTSQQVLFQPFLQSSDKGDFGNPMVRFAKILKEQTENLNSVKSLDLIQETCDMISNQIITTEYLGIRKTEFDLDTPNSKFVAFQMKDGRVRFVFTSKRVTTLKDHNIFEEFQHVYTTDFNANSQNDENEQWNPDFTCSYHNDDYFIGLDLKEMYLISFFVEAKNFNKLIFPKKKKVINKEISVVNTKKQKNKIQGKTDINSLFSNLLI